MWPNWFYLPIDTAGEECMLEYVLLDYVYAGIQRPFNTGIPTSTLIMF